MRTDIYGQPIYTENDICDLYMSDTQRQIKKIYVDKDIKFLDILDLENIPNIVKYTDPNVPVNVYDKTLQKQWLMPEEYKTLDIAKYVLLLCKTDEELQRVGHELLLFQKRDMFDLLRYLKYLVDVMRENNIVWGVGRGSSVSSYVLYLLGVHRINSLYYDLPIEEFLKQEK